VKKSTAQMRAAGICALGIMTANIKIAVLCGKRVKSDDRKEKCGKMQKMVAMGKNPSFSHPVASNQAA
jgi:hypothetical protein